MKRLTINDILKPDAILETGYIDFDKRPDLVKLFYETKEEQERLKRLKEIDYEQLNLRITI